MSPTIERNPRAMRAILAACISFTALITPRPGLAEEPVAAPDRPDASDSTSIMQPGWAQLELGALVSRENATDTAVATPRRAVWPRAPRLLRFHRDARYPGVVVFARTEPAPLDGSARPFGGGWTSIQGRSDRPNVEDIDAMEGRGV